MTKSNKYFFLINLYYIDSGEFAFAEQVHRQTLPAAPIRLHPCRRSLPAGSQHLQLHHCQVQGGPAAGQELPLQVLVKEVSAGAPEDPGAGGEPGEGEG